MEVDVRSELLFLFKSKVENVLGCGVFPVLQVGFISKCGSGTVPNAAACQSQFADYESARALGWAVVEANFFYFEKLV